MNINGKVFAITGGGRGLGRAVAEGLAKKGGRIALLDLDESAMAETAELVRAAGSDIHCYRCDVADEELVINSFKQIVDDFGRLHGLVNNAGVLRDARLIKVKDGKVIDRMSCENFELVVDVHLKGAFLCAREAAAHMVEQGVDEGCIVSMSSGAFRGNFGQSNYSAAKAGIVAMSRVWSKELAKFNIRSMAIAPGTIETDMLRSLPSEALAGLAKMVPLGRIGDARNIAQTVEFIFENDYLSGDVIDVCGGGFV